MKRYISYAMIALLATIAVSMPRHRTRTAMEAKEKAAWQAFKDKNEADFKKVVDNDIRCVYADGIANMAKELADMQKWDMKSFAISDYDIFSDEKDVMVATYTVTIEGTFDGKDVSGTYNAGTVWKKEGNKWLAIFHTNIKQAAPNRWRVILNWKKRCSRCRCARFRQRVLYWWQAYRLRFVSDDLSLVTYHSNVDEIAGEPMAERSETDDPLNLMRVMPP